MEAESTNFTALARNIQSHVNLTAQFIGVPVVLIEMFNGNTRIIPACVSTAYIEDGDLKFNIIGVCSANGVSFTRKVLFRDVIFNLNEAEEAITRIMSQKTCAFMETVCDHLTKGNFEPVERMTDAVVNTNGGEKRD